MTAIAAPAQPLHPAASAVPRSLVRLLRLELRRHPWPWLIVPLAGLLWFDPYRTAMGYPPVWGVRAAAVLTPDVVPFAAGIAAWIGSREARRGLADLVAATPRAGWTRWGSAMAATYGWILATYLGFVAVLYAVTAYQATWGGPPLWPVAVGAAQLAAACAIGFAAGALVPSRFTAGLAAIGSFLAVMVGFREALAATSGYALLSPYTSVPYVDEGVFYRVPDLPIAQVIFLAGLALAAAGLLGLPAAAGGRVLRAAATGLTVAGLAMAGTGIGLAGTARQQAHGVIIPALHDTASDRPVPYTPACATAAGIAVCVHPAFKTYLPHVITALGPVLAEVAGLPGAPTRVQQSATEAGVPSPLMGGIATISGSPPVFDMPIPPGPGDPADVLIDSVRTDLVTTYISGHGAFVVPTGTPAQQAVATALLTVAGTYRPQHAEPLPADVSAAATRFATLPATARHTWLQAHLAALRAGHLTLAQLP